VGVVVEIADQKYARGDERDDHRGAVLRNVTASDEIMADGEQNGGRTVQCGIDGRKDAVVDLHLVVYAAGRVVRRFTMTKASAKINAVNNASIASEVAIENWFIEAVDGKSAVLSASIP
jgi:hypothetical protein